MDPCKLVLYLERVVVILVFRLCRWFEMLHKQRNYVFL